MRRFPLSLFILSMRRFPLSLFIYPKLCSFGLLLKMRCIFFTEQPYTDQGSTPGPPMLCFLIWNRHFDCRIQRKLNSGLWRTAFGKVWLFRCQSTFATLVCQRNCVFLCKGTKLQKAVLFAVVRRSFMEESCRGFFNISNLLLFVGKLLCSAKKILL